MFREDRQTEFKQSISNSYLKTVSAFANYEGGKIYFGIQDDGATCGIQDPVTAALNLENQINDNITPSPVFGITIQEGDVIVLEIQSGKQTPYYYKNKAYKRSDTSSVPVDRYELNNLILKGRNQSYTELPSAEQNLTFEAFSKSFQDRFNLQAVFPDTFVTLELFSSQEGFTNAAALLSDQNPFPGIDIVIYGKNRSQILKRERLEKQSVLTLLESCITEFENKYLYEEITLHGREIREKISSKAFRELITNALIHRDWQLPVHIKVEMEENAVTVTSPGSLPEGINQHEYLSSRHISVLRNKTLGLIFLKLGKIENLGSGLPMILEQYREALKKPEFIVEQNYLSTTLPVMQLYSLNSSEEQLVLDLVRLMQPVSAIRLLEKTQLSRSTQQRLLNSLIEQGLIQKSGSGRNTRYLLNR